jgi:hypothetical protein
MYGETQLATLIDEVLETFNKEKSLHELNDDFIAKIQARHPSIQGVSYDSIVATFADEFAQIRLEIQTLKKQLEEITQPKEGSHLTGSSYVLKI